MFIIIENVLTYLHQASWIDYTLVSSRQKQNIADARDLPNINRYRLLTYCDHWINFTPDETYCKEKDKTLARACFESAKARSSVAELKGNPVS